VTINRVEFFADGVSIGTDASAPYSAVLDGTSAGTRQLLAVATDSLGVTLTSAPVAITLTAPAAGTALVSFGDIWNYLDDGSRQAVNWPSRAFDDRLWSRGPARLGYGDDGELTTVSYGPNPNAKHVTTYFRKTFQVANPAAFTGLLLRLVRDDGAVVYLNGIEVHRNNLQPGLVSWNSLATAAVDGAGEQIPLEVSLSPAALVAGTNVVAVEIHQVSISSGDLGFNLALTGLSDANTAPGIYLTSPANGSHFNAPASIPLSAYPVAADGVTLVEYFHGATKIGEAFAPPYEFTWDNPTVGPYSLTARASYSGGPTLTSDPVSIVVGAPPGPVAPVFQTLIPARSDWNYWDNVAGVGNGWERMTFNDASWPGAPARFGFGLDGEATPLNQGRTSYYFRRWFNVANPALLDQLVFQLVRDDGAVVYLNGVELFRSNMPEGPVVAATLASATVNTPDETTYFESILGSTGSGLLGGSNLIAVELHQASAASSDLGFDLQLLAYGTTEDRVVLARPATAGSYHLADPIPLEAFVWTPGPRTVSKVEFFVQGQKVGETTVAPYQAALTATNYGTYVFTASATFSDGGTADSDPVSVRVIRQPVTTTLIASNSVWRYLDDGSNQGTNWTQIDYAETGWKSGAARLGYGGDGEVTAVSYGANAANKYITTYFRRAFVVPSGFVYTNLIFRLVRDDGAVIWVNGHEVFRSNMISTPVTFTTLASAPVSGADEQTFFSTSVNGPALAAGTNVVAVEMHQNAPNSSDLGFNLELIGEGYLADDPRPRLEIRLDDGMVELSWPVSAVGWQVYGAPSVITPSSGWIPVSGETGVVNGRWVMTISADAAEQFFRLSRP
jgi:hypothetical protein